MRPIRKAGWAFPASGALFLLAILCLSPASPAATQDAADPLQSSPTGLGASLRWIDADLAGKIGFNNPSYADLVASTPPVDPSTTTGVRISAEEQEQGRSLP